jgi:hypothetical protein
MGTPPGCVYHAILYFGIWELEIVLRFQSNLPFYCRYIDDCFGLWLCNNDPVIDHQKWTAFQASMDSYGKLEWIFSECSELKNFLDLTLHLIATGIHTTLFEKEMNLYLYLPPHSAHPPRILRGLIVGMIKRIFCLTTTFSDKETAVHTLFCCLTARGYHSTAI